MVCPIHPLYLHLYPLYRFLHATTTTTTTPSLHFLCMHACIHTHNIDTRMGIEKNQYARFDKAKSQDKTNLKYTGEYSQKLMQGSRLMAETYYEIEKAKEVM